MNYGAKTVAALNKVLKARKKQLEVKSKHVVTTTKNLPDPTLEMNKRVVMEAPIETVTFAKRGKSGLKLGKNVLKVREKTKDLITKYQGKGYKLLNILANRKLKRLARNPFIHNI